MDFTPYVRKPFVVQAVEITVDNIEEAAPLIGDLRLKEDGSPYILVEPRLVPNIERVYPGYFMTKIGDRVHCYSRWVFNKMFVEKNDEIQPWLDFLDKKTQVGAYGRIVKDNGAPPTPE